jgi:hypothetical protein
MMHLIKKKRKYHIHNIILVGKAMHCFLRTYRHSTSYTSGSLRTTFKNLFRIVLGSLISYTCKRIIYQHFILLLNNLSLDRCRCAKFMTKPPGFSSIHKEPRKLRYCIRLLCLHRRYTNALLFRLSTLLL